MIKELGCGVLIGILLFLIYTGYDITPLLVLGSFGIVLYMIAGKKGIISNNQKNNLISNKTFSFNDIGGQETPKQELREALDFLLKSEQINIMGIRPLKGILLTGPPGTGKTLLAKAAAGYCDAVFLAASGSEFIEMYAGVGAQRVRKIFQQARDMAKKEKKDRSIIFIDEIEVLGGKRGSHSSHLEYDQTLNQLLVEMDGLSNNDEGNLLLIAATNRPDLLDSALLRPGRFDRQVRVDLPDKAGRIAILELHCRNKPLAPEVSIEEIANSTFGFSGAHLESLTNEAAILAMRENSTTIKQCHLREAVDKIILGEKLGIQASKETLKRVSVHESGHALISELFKPGSVDQITVTSRGNALGYVRHVQEEDQYLYTKSALENQIKILLGGAVSEELFFGERSTGAANDFQQALDYTTRIINTGLSHLGVVPYDKMPPQELYTACQKILTDMEDQVRNLLKENMEVLQKISEILMKEEKITGKELRKFLKEELIA